jgi:COP9 signalosome complex subunit 4
LDEGERLQALYVYTLIQADSSHAAVTAALIAPSGPLRSRILGNLNRDDRASTSLPPHLATMLRKMLLEYILRPEEVKEFASGLQDHQRAKVEGGGTVLERAVREHNVGACAKVNSGYDLVADVRYTIISALTG